VLVGDVKHVLEVHLKGVAAPAKSILDEFGQKLGTMK
jgi:hypothetical protein